MSTPRWEQVDVSRKGRYEPGAVADEFDDVLGGETRPFEQDDLLEYDDRMQEEDFRTLGEWL